MLCFKQCTNRYFLDSCFLDGCLLSLNKPKKNVCHSNNFEQVKILTVILLTLNNLIMLVVILLSSNKSKILVVILLTRFGK